MDEVLSMYLTQRQWKLREEWGRKVDRYEWMRSKISKWEESVHILGKIYWRYPHTAYTDLTILLKLEWQLPQWDVTGAG